MRSELSVQTSGLKGLNFRGTPLASSPSKCGHDEWLLVCCTYGPLSLQDPLCTAKEKTAIVSNSGNLELFGLVVCCFLFESFM